MANYYRWFGREKKNTIPGVVYGTEWQTNQGVIGKVFRSVPNDMHLLAVAMD